MNEPHETDRLTVNRHPGDGKHNNSPDELNKVNILKSEPAHYTKNNDTLPLERVKFEGLDEDNTCSDDSDDVPLPPIPDGGWGWVVVVSAFLAYALADGPVVSFGLLHEDFPFYFETTKSKTALIRSLFIATPLLAGPIMGALVNRYGCRVMTMIAGLISTIGFLLASVSISVEMLWLAFVFLSVLAMGILNVTAVVSVVFWFDKRRNLAVSLASCGIGFGTLIYRKLTTYLIQEYGWRGTLVLLAVSLLNMCVCGAVMRNPEWLEIKQKRERRSSKARSRRSSTAGSVISRSVGGESVFICPEELKSLLKSGKSPDYILETLASTIAEAEQLEATTQMNAEPSAKRIHSAIHLPTFVQHNEKVPPEVIEKLMDNNRLYNIILQNYPDLITRQRSEANINLEDSSLHATGKDPTELPVQVRVKNPNNPINSDWSLASSIEEMMCFNRCFDVLKTTFRMFTEFHFLMFNLASLILSIWFMVPFYYLNFFMAASGFDRAEGAQMIVTIGAASRIGLVLLGWFGDQPWVNVCKAYAACLIICGASVAIYPFFNINYRTLAVISTVFGLFCRSFYSYTPSILMELMPIDHFPVAYGMILLSQGIGNFVGPPIIYQLYGMTDNLDLIFYMGGFWLVIAGLCVGVVAYTKNARMCGSAPLLKEADGRNKEINDV